MTFEEDSLEEAMVVLKELEGKCAQNLGWIRAMKNRVFGKSVSIFNIILFITQFIDMKNLRSSVL